GRVVPDQVPTRRSCWLQSPCPPVMQVPPVRAGSAGAEVKVEPIIRCHAHFSGEWSWPVKPSVPLCPRRPRITQRERHGLDGVRACTSPNRFRATECTGSEPDRQLLDKGEGLVSS